MKVKRFCEDKLPHDVELYNHFHALIVQNGKEHCKKKPVCQGCPLDEVPFEFWQLLAFYISSNTLSAVPWAIPFGEGQVQVMLDQAEDVLGWYDNMKNVVPTWYQGG